MEGEQRDRPTTLFTAASVPVNYQRRLAPVVFEPWAEVLVGNVGVRPGDHVLDVASGTGVVARRAGRQAGPAGRVVACDVSAAMLAHAATVSVAEAAAIDYVEAPADRLPFAAASFDVVLCQQGLQFFPDRAAALGEMHRVLRAGGAVGIAVWAAGYRLQPFDDYTEALAAAGVPPPFPHAFENKTFVMDPDDVGEMLKGAGFSTVEVSVLTQTITFPGAGSAAAAILGTPFGPVVEGLEADRRGALFDDLERRFAPSSPGAPISRDTSSVIIRATA